MALKQRIELKDNVCLTKLDVPRKDGTLIASYISVSEKEGIRPKPLLFLLHGSGCSSVFARCDDGKLVVPFMFRHLQRQIDNWNIVFVEKRGVRFGDCSKDGSSCSREYHEYATRQTRIEDVGVVLEYLIVTIWDVITDFSGMKDAIERINRPRSLSTC